MSDLQCAVRVLVAGPGLSPESLVDQRVAGVWSDPSPASVERARGLAADLGVGVHEVGELATGFAGSMEEIADTHRGETVLVLVERDHLVDCLTTLVPVPTDGGVDRLLDAGQPLVLLGDADGWVLEDPGSRGPE